MIRKAVDFLDISEDLARYSGFWGFMEILSWRRMGVVGDLSCWVRGFGGLESMQCF